MNAVFCAETLYLYQKFKEMSHENSDRNYFDDSTSILAPVYIIIALGVAFGILFFG